MHILKPVVRALALCACVLLASCAPASEADILSMSTPKADKYARQVVSYMRARDTAALAHRFSPALMQIPGAADSLAALARFFPPGTRVEQVRLVGAASHWNSQLTLRRLSYEVRSTDSAFTAVEVVLLEDDLDNLYLDGAFVTPLDGPVPATPSMNFGGRSIFAWAFFGLLLLCGGLVVFFIIRTLRGRGQGRPAGLGPPRPVEVPLFAGQQPAPARPRAHARPQPLVPPAPVDEAPRPMSAWARGPARGSEPGPEHAAASAAAWTVYGGGFAGDDTPVAHSEPAAEFVPDCGPETTAADSAAPASDDRAADFCSSSDSAGSYDSGSSIDSGSSLDPGSSSDPGSGSGADSNW